MKGKGTSPSSRKDGYDTLPTRIDCEAYLDHTDDQTNASVDTAEPVLSLLRHRYSVVIQLR